MQPIREMSAHSILIYNLGAVLLSKILPKAQIHLIYSIAF